MNKASRRSGGKALKEAPEKLVALLKNLNVFKDFVASPEMSDLLEMGYHNHLRPLGIELVNFYNDSKSDRLVKFLKAFAIDDSVEAKKDWLADFICSMPEQLALDIIEQCPMHQDSDPKEILSAMKEIGFDLFEDHFTGTEGKQEPIENFYICLNRFEEILATYNFLYDISHPQIFLESYEDRFFKWRDNGGSAYRFGIINTIQPYRPFVRVERDSKLKLVVHFSEYLKLLNEVEIERIRICPRCEKFFWAGRKDVTGCSDCSEILRKKKWRDNLSKKKLQYSETGKRKG